MKTLCLAFALTLAGGWTLASNISNGTGGATVNAPYLTGSTGLFFGPMYQLVKPTDTTFVWRNQGTATIATTNGSVYINSGAGTSGYNWRVREVACPATPYIIDITFRGFANTLTVQDYAGIVLTDGTKLESFHTGYDSVRMGVFTWNSVTAVSGTVKDGAANYGGMTAFAAPYHLRWSDDGANRLMQYSVDKINYITFYTEATNTFLTPTTCGFGVNTQGTAAENVGMAVYSWHIQ